jgi:hypothetical protein
VKSYICLNKPLILLLITWKKKELLVRRVNKKKKEKKNIILTKMAQSLQKKKILNRLYDYEYQAFSLLTEEKKRIICCY